MDGPCLAYCGKKGLRNMKIAEIWYVKSELSHDSSRVPVWPTVDWEIYKHNLDLLVRLRCNLLHMLQGP